MSVSGFNVGDLIAGKYEVTEILGEGGMGVVLAARHRELDELVALKFLLPQLRTNPEVCARFAREAKTGIRIKNEHVARVLDVSTLPDGSAFMVMEHLVGEDLATMLVRRGPLPAGEAVDLLLQACEAIAEAHALGVVHRDLKPANLFVTTGSDGLPFVKVLDFGISKTVDLDSISVTATATVLGSPLYMSPEQLASSRDVDRRSDVWSLGVILFEMLTGTTPFHGTSFPTLCAAILAGKYVDPSIVRPGVPVAFDSVVADALKLDREARLPGVDVFATRIAAFGSEAAAQSSSRIRRISTRLPSMAPSRPSVVPASAFEATLPVESSPSLPDASPGSLPRGTAAGLARSSIGESPAPRSRTAVVLPVGVAIACVIACAAWWSTSTGPAAPRQLVAGGHAVASSEGPGDLSAPKQPPEAPPAALSAQASTASAAPPVHHAASSRPASSSSARPDDLFGSQK